MICKISSDQKRFFIALSLYPLSFFVNTPFKIKCFLKLKTGFFIPTKPSHFFVDRIFLLLIIFQGCSILKICRFIGKIPFEISGRGISQFPKNIKNYLSVVVRQSSS